MKRLIYMLPFLLLPLFVIAQQASMATTDPDQAFLEARKMAFDGSYEESRTILQAILEKYPEYSDVRNLLAKTYSWEGEYEKARSHFNRITTYDKTNLEVWVADIKNELYDGKEIVAFSKVNTALVHLPKEQELVNLKEKINKRLIRLSEPEQETNVAKGSRANENSTFQHALGLISGIDVFDQVYDTQYFVGAEYRYKLKFTQLIPRITYANRFSMTGLQFELDAYPKLSKTGYLYMNYGYSDSPIFPNHRAGLEVFDMLSKTMEFSVGGRYIDFRESKVMILTGSLCLYKGNYYFSARPYITPRSENPTGYAGSLMVRKYGKTGDHFIGLTAGMGVAPESQQLFAGDTLLSEAILYVESQQILLDFQFTGKKTANLYRANVGITRQEFVSLPGEFFFAFSAGLQYFSRF